MRGAVGRDINILNIPFRVNHSTVTLTTLVSYEAALTTAYHINIQKAI